MKGNDTQRWAEQVQERAFRDLMSVREEKPPVVNPGVDLRVSIFECVKIKQPAQAWALGWMAGWPEMVNA